MRMQWLSGKAGMVLLQLLPDRIVEAMHGLPEKGAYLLRRGPGGGLPEGAGGRLSVVGSPVISCGAAIIKTAF